MAFFFFPLRRKFCIVVAQVWGYYSKLPNEGVRNTCSQLMAIKHAHKISTLNLDHSGHLGTKSNYSGSTEFYCSGNMIFIRKFAHRLADDDNYHDKRASLPVSLRTRKLEKKIHYCCRDYRGPYRTSLFFFFDWNCHLKCLLQIPTCWIFLNKQRIFTTKIRVELILKIHNSDFQSKNSSCLFVY